MDSNASVNTSKISHKIFTILIYALLILAIPIFLDYLFRLTVRRKRRLNIMLQAEKKSKKTKKPILIFNSVSEGIIDGTFVDGAQKEDFDGHIDILLDKLQDNAFVIVLSETLEYVSEPEKTIQMARRVSGGDLYIVSLESSSPRIWFDYKLRQYMEKPFYLPTDSTISWNIPNNLQLKTQNIYAQIFKIIPYDRIVPDHISSK